MPKFFTEHPICVHTSYVHIKILRAVVEACVCVSQPIVHRMITRKRKCKFQSKWRKCSFTQEVVVFHEKSWVVVVVAFQLFLRGATDSRSFIRKKERIERRGKNTPQHTKFVRSTTHIRKEKEQSKSTRIAQFIWLTYTMSNKCRIYSSSPCFSLSITYTRSYMWKLFVYNNLPKKNIFNLNVDFNLNVRKEVYIRANFDYLISIIMLEIQSRSFEIIHSMVICN